MDDEHLSELVSQFIGITDAPSAKAQQYLRISDNNLEQAIELFFNTGGIDLEETAPQTSQPPPVPPPHTRPGAQNEVIDLDSDDGFVDDDVEVVGSEPRAGNSGRQPATTDAPSAARPAAQDDDEAIARRLQEEFYAGGDAAGTVDAEGYRAPIASTRETLVGPDSYNTMTPEDMRAAVAEQMQLRQERARGMILRTFSGVHELTFVSSKLATRDLQSAIKSIHLDRFGRELESGTGTDASSCYRWSIAGILEIGTACRDVPTTLRNHVTRFLG